MNEIKREIPKSYGIEDEIELYNLWEKSGFFNPDKMDSQKDPFVMTLPPPNANGELHVGHTCGYSFQDAVGRYNRMKGRPTLLLPGKDHAGIQTETVFTKVLKKQGVDKWKLGREEFYKQAYDFCMKNADHARDQEKRIGLSADWSREKFTLDPKLTSVIYETFCKMFEEGLIYRGVYIINQCTHCRTALADVDTDHVMKKGIFAYIKYPLVDGKDEFVTVATTRPETMLGDTAVAVNPSDKRYKKYVGREVYLPLTDRKIPIIADKTIDAKLGTGALKVTPAHSSIDYKIGLDHDLEILNVIDESGKMNGNAPAKYVGMTVTVCREEVLNDLREKDYLEKVEDIEHEVIVCERCKNDIEQIMSKQWFVNVEPLAKKCIEVLDKKQTKIVPVFQEKVMRHWFENIEPWCISRQLWWGHRIPVWYCGGKQLHDWLIDNPHKTKDDFEKATGIKVEGCGNAIASVDKPNSCNKCKGNTFEQETDVFDTWFSSGQWNFSTMGGLEGEDFKKFYPTDVMETMHDILFFWVARMMMLALYRTGETPFHTVYLHGMILAPDGKKMSKSAGNGIEPADLYDKYGADALRLWYFLDTQPARPSPIRYEKLQGNRNFVNKVWNASRFVMLQMENYSDEEIKKLDDVVKTEIGNIEKSDNKWLSDTYKLAGEISGLIDKYKFNLAVENTREFFWHEFCDKWIEETKTLIQKEPDKKIEYLGKLIATLIIQMKLLHPFAPFVTEKVWQSLRNLGLLGWESDLLMISKWPV